ncbi:YIPF6-like, partial [Homarus americanus]
IPDFVDPGGYGDVSGEMAVPGTVGKTQAKEYNTLDEPVRETIMRDLRAVGTKFYHVLYPREKKALLKDWDLWGPLILCTFIAMMVQGSEGANEPDGGPEFAQVFVIVWIIFPITAMIFLGDSQPSTRKALAVYPIFLFYFVIAWLIISHSNA